MIEHISAVTFAVQDMTRSIEFYRLLGFALIYGGNDAAFSTLKSGEAFVNLIASQGYQPRWWGRVILRVDNVDEHHRTLQARGLTIPAPQDASWGERFFHITDPDGHEISFAQPLPAASSRR